MTHRSKLSSSSMSSDVAVIATIAVVSVTVLAGVGVELRDQSTEASPLVEQHALQNTRVFHGAPLPEARSQVDEILEPEEYATLSDEELTEILAPLGVAGNRLLVQFKRGMSASQKNTVLRSNGLAEEKGPLDTALDPLGIVPVKITDRENWQESVRELSANPRVVFAVPDALVQVASDPNDAYYSEQWNHQEMRLGEAFDFQALGQGVTMAIVDTGVDPDHPDLADKLVPGWNFYDNNSDTRDIHGHGTAVAGAAAATCNNIIGVAGGACLSSIMPLRVSGPGGTAPLSNITIAVRYAADHGASVVNVSFGPLYCYGPMENAALYAFNRGTLTFIAFGNDATHYTYSCGAVHSLYVAATVPGGGIAGFSSFGRDGAFAAPGSLIWTTFWGGGYGPWGGTSFASPIAASVAALVKSVNPNFTASQVKNILIESAIDLGDQGRDDYYGYGLVNFATAVERACQEYPAGCILDTEPPTAPGNLQMTSLEPRSVSLSWTASTDNVAVMGYRIFRDGLQIAQVSATTLSYTDSSVLPSTSYTYTVKAFDAAGNVSPPSNPVSVTTPPETGTITMIIDDGDIGFSSASPWYPWTDDQEGVPGFGYNGSVSWTDRPSDLGGDVRTACWSAVGLTPGVTYDIATHWTGTAWAAVDTPFEVLDGQGGTLIPLQRVNQRTTPFDAGPGWKNLGAATVNGTGEIRTCISTDATQDTPSDGWVIADAVRLEEAQ